MLGYVCVQGQLRMSAPVIARGSVRASAAQEPSSSSRCCASIAAASRGSTPKKGASNSSGAATKLPNLLFREPVSFQPVSASHLRQAPPHDRL